MLPDRAARSLDRLSTTRAHEKKSRVRNDLRERECGAALGSALALLLARAATQRLFINRKISRVRWSRHRSAHHAGRSRSAGSGNLCHQRSVPPLPGSGVHIGLSGGSMFESVGATFRRSVGAFALFVSGSLLLGSTAAAQTVVLNQAGQVTGRRTAAAVREQRLRWRS